MHMSCLAGTPPASPPRAQWSFQTDRAATVSQSETVIGYRLGLIRLQTPPDAASLFDRGMPPQT